MMQRWIFKQNTVCLIFHVECVWWLLIIIASTLTIHLTVQHLENNKILVLVSDVAAICMFKSSMTSPGDIFVWVSLWLSANIPSYCLLHFLPRNGIVCDNIWGGGGRGWRGRVPIWVFTIQCMWQLKLLTSQYMQPNWVSKEIPNFLV